MKALPLCCGVVAGLLGPSGTRADEFLALPGLWQSTYEIHGVDHAAEDPGVPRIVWHCVDEAADPWTAFAQLRDLPGMACVRNPLERTSTSLKWRMECRAPGPGARADVIETTGAIVFDSAQHYTGWVKLSGMLMGYPWQSTAKLEGWRRAACTSPAD